MKLILSQPLFAQAIETAASVADKKIEHVADFILLTVKDGVLTVIGTDMERESKTCVTLEQASEDGIALVSGKKLKDLVKFAPSDSVVTFKSNPKEPEAFTMTFSGTRSRFTLRGKDATMFPSIEMDGTQKTLTVDRVQFSRALDAMSKFMADQDVRYYLNGVQLVADAQSVKLTATDGHRLSQSRVALESNSADAPFDVIIPRKAVFDIIKMLKSGDETIQISTTANHVVLTLGSNTYISKLIDGKFPDAERVIPRKNQVVYRANRSLLIGSLTRASILANQKFRGIRMNFTGNELSIESNNPEQDSANEVVDIESVTQGNVEIGFNVNYVIDALQMYTDENVLIELQDGNSSALIRTEAANDHIAVLMPMRL